MKGNRQEKMELYSVEQMREADAYTIHLGISAVTLMGRAAHGAFQTICGLQGKGWDKTLIQTAYMEGKFSFPEKPRIIIAVGGGNNGGDGWALACELQENEYPVRVISFSEKSTAASLFYKEKAKQMHVRFQDYKNPADLLGADLIVDCLLGTGFKGEPTGAVLDGILAIRSSKLPVLAMDINSGMDGDTGNCTYKDGIPLCTDSLVTMTIGLWKKGLITAEARTHIKNLVLCDIGIVIPPTMDSE